MTERATLVEHVTRRLETEGPTRGVALWGPAGVGKTWLAQQSSPDAVVEAESVGGWAALTRLLGSTPGPVLVLDGLDLWLDEDEEALTALLTDWLSDPARRLVTTHRRRWTPPFAQAVAVAPMGLDDAMALFLNEVDRLHGPSRPSAEEQTAIREVLPTLDGLPRAVHWAATRWGVLGTEGLVTRLREGVPHALIRDVEAQIAALAEPDQIALAGLVVFVGPFTPQDAQVVADPDNDDLVLLLASLHDATLLHRVSPGTFRVPRAVRQAVAASPKAVERHANWCLAQHPDPDRQRPDRVHAEDLAAASRWLVSQGDPRAGTLLIALAAAAPGQHLELIEAARQQAPSPEVHRAHSRVLRLRGRLAEAAHTLKEGLALAGADVRAAGPLWRHWGVLQHTLGEWDEAREGYQQALACARELGDVHGVALATANLGTIDHDRCAYEDAEQHYAEALTGLRAANDPQVELTVRANQAVLWQELGKLEQAETGYRQALVLLERARHPHMMAITRGNLGLLLHEQARLEEAEAVLRQALEGLGPVEDPKTEGLCLARLAAVHADRGQMDAADSAWEAAIWAVQRCDSVTQQVVELFGAFVDLAHDRDASVRLVAAESVVQFSGDARIAARMIRRRIAAAPATLRIDDDGFVPPGGERIDLSRHVSIRRMFQALVDTAQVPGRVLDVDALFTAGWPDERINPDSMRNRVHVNLAKLRRWGLKSLIERTDQGYRLQATIVHGSGA
ncbi:MAG: tetratricopeptide repeat protein [Myxococcota bacterium]